MKKASVYVLTLILLIAMLNACGGGDDENVVVPPPGAPVIDSFTADPETVEAGETSTLSWSLSGEAPTTLEISPDVGDVMGSTDTEVTPTETTTYTLTASNAAGEGPLVGCRRR